MEKRDPWLEKKVERNGRLGVLKTNLGVIYNMTSDSGKQFGSSSKHQAQSTLWSSKPLLRIYPEKEKQTSTQNSYAHVHSSKNIQNKLNNPSTDEWINKLWYIHTMEYYLAIKRNEVLGCLGSTVFSSGHDPRAQGLSPAQQGAWCRTRSRDSRITTWAEGSRLTNWATQAP